MSPRSRFARVRFAALGALAWTLASTASAGASPSDDMTFRRQACRFRADGAPCAVTLSTGPMSGVCRGQVCSSSRVTPAAAPAPSRPGRRAPPSPAQCVYLVSYCLFILVRARSEQERQAAFGGPAPEIGAGFIFALFLCTPVALPIYFYRTRGPSGLGPAIGWSAVGGFLAIALSASTSLMIHAWAPNGVLPFWPT